MFTILLLFLKPFFLYNICVMFSKYSFAKNLRMHRKYTSEVYFAKTAVAHVVNRNVNKLEFNCKH